jgi:arylsulfatase A-like enzyme
MLLGHRRSRVRPLAMVFGVVAIVSASGYLPAKPPNILFIITDQQHAGMMSCAGNRDLSTPSLDRLAQQGVRFEHAYVTNPVCVPSRISMATGVMAGRLGVFENGMRATVPPEVEANSLGKLFKRAGYETFYGGKVHMCPELNPLDAGYDEYFRDEREDLPRACIDFMERKRERPFLVVASFINPHDICFAYQAFEGKSARKKESVEALYQQAAALPMEKLPPLPFNFEVPRGEPEAIELFSSPNAVTPSGIMRQKYDEREWRIYRWIYCRLTEKADRLVGDLLDAVQRMGIDDETLVVFTSDHGDMDACHRLASKGRFYEKSVKVPFLLKYPGQVLAGHVDHEHFVSSGMDILPTLCDFAGIEIPESAMGRSLRTLAAGREDPAWREFVVTENHTGRMLRTRDFKYCLYSQGNPRESLVDLRNDPGELVNVATIPDYQLTLREHRRLLRGWMQESQDHPGLMFAIE